MIRDNITFPFKFTFSFIMTAQISFSFLIMCCHERKKVNWKCNDRSFGLVLRLFSLNLICWEPKITDKTIRRWPLSHSSCFFLFLTVDRLFILGLEAIHLSLRTEIGAVCWKEFYSWMKRFLPRSIKEKVNEEDRGERNLWIKNNSFPFPWAWSRSDSAWGAQAQEKEGNVHPWRRET